MKLSSRDMRLLDLAPKCTAAKSKRGCTGVEEGFKKIQGSMVLLLADTCQAQLQVLQVLDILGSSGLSQERIVLSTEYMQRSVTCMASQPCCVSQKLVASRSEPEEVFEAALGPLHCCSICYRAAA